MILSDKKLTDAESNYTKKIGVIQKNYYTSFRSNIVLKTELELS